MLQSTISQHDTNVKPKPLAEHLRDAIELNKTLPGETPLWTFTRCAKGHPSLAGLDAEIAADRVKEILGDWQEHFPGVTDPAFELVECWDKITTPIRNPKGYDYMVNALRLADSEPLEVKVPTEGYRRFLSYSYHLQRLVGDTDIFLPLGRTAVILFSQDTPAGRKMISRYRQRAVRDRWLRQTKNYSPHKLACEYRFSCERIDPQTLDVRKPILLAPKPCQVSTVDKAIQSRNSDVTQDTQLISSRNSEEFQDTQLISSRNTKLEHMEQARMEHGRTSPPAPSKNGMTYENEIPRETFLSLSGLQPQDAVPAGAGNCLRGAAGVRPFQALGRTRWVSVEPPPDGFRAKGYCCHCDGPFDAERGIVRLGWRWAHADCHELFLNPPPVDIDDLPPEPPPRGIFD